MRSGLVIGLILLPFTVSAKPGVAEAFWKLSRPEKGWVLAHPFKAKRAFHVTQQVRHTTDSLYRLQLPDTFRHGGRIDAFRHSYWMAMLTQRIGERPSRKLGRCHERGNRIKYRKGKTEDGYIQDATACEMDLHNNEQGIRLALEHPNEGRDGMARECLKAIRSGKMKILFINADGAYCDCDGKPVNMVRKGMDKWKLPICLLSSEWPQPVSRKTHVSQPAKQ